MMTEIEDDDEDWATADDAADDDNDSNSVRAKKPDFKFSF